jgi:hypothetical protein
MSDLFDDLLTPSDDFGETKAATNVLVVGAPAANSAELTKLARYVEGHPVKVVFVEEDGREFVVEKGGGSIRIN